MKEKACQQMSLLTLSEKHYRPTACRFYWAEQRNDAMFVYEKLKHFAVTHSLDFYQDELDPVEHSKERWWRGKKS